MYQIINLVSVLESFLTVTSLHLKIVQCCYCRSLCLFFIYIMRFECVYCEPQSMLSMQLCKINPFKNVYSVWGLGTSSPLEDYFDRLVAGNYFLKYVLTPDDRHFGNYQSNIFIYIRHCLKFDFKTKRASTFLNNAFISQLPGGFFPSEQTQNWASRVIHKPLPLCTVAEGERGLFLASPPFFPWAGRSWQVHRT